jgi:diadenylate cyclase
MTPMLNIISWDLVGSAVVEILVLFGVIYAILRFLQGTPGAGLLRGFAVVLIGAMIVVLIAVGTLHLYRIQYLASGVFAWVMIVLIVLFQPEFRRAFTRLGEYPLMRWFMKPDSSVIAEVSEAAIRLSKLKMGAIVTLQREVGLGAYAEGGTRLDAAVTADLLVSIFWPGSPLHDGAVIVANDRIVAAGCLFPLTETHESTQILGTRHRAAIGVTEESDAISVVVSEETGQVSVAYRGRLTRGLDVDGLQRVLEAAVAETTPLHREKT